VYRGCIIQNIKCDSLKGKKCDSLKGKTCESHFVEVLLLRKYFQMLLMLLQNLSLREAFETATQITEKLRAKRTEFSGAFGKIFKLLIDRKSLKKK